MLQISFEMVAMCKTMTSSSTGGKCLPFKVCDPVPFLAHPLCSPYILPIWGLWVQIQRLQKMSSKFIEIIYNKFCFFKFTGSFQLKAVTNFFLLQSTSHTKLIQCSKSHWSRKLYLISSWPSFHYFFQLP